MDHAAITAVDPRVLERKTVMRLPKQAKPVMRKVSTARIEAKVNPSFGFGDIKKFVKGPGKQLACAACAAIPHPVAKIACMVACGAM